MKDTELAVLWCALNCTTGPDISVTDVMGVIQKRVGKQQTLSVWRQLGGNSRMIQEALLAVGRANNASSRTAGTSRQTSKSKPKKATAKVAGSPSRR